MHKIRITSLAQNIGVKSRLVLEVLAELGMASGKSRGSSLNETEAAKVWAHFERRGIFASIGRTLTAGDSAKEQKTICPACKRSVDRGKLPIHIRNPYLAPEVSATLRFVKCPLCKMRYSKNTRLAFLQKARQIKPSPLSSAVEGGASDGLFLKKPLLEMAVAKKLVAKNPIVKEKFGRMSGRTPLRILSVQTSEQDFDASCCIPCNQCGHLIREDAMVLHYENNHSEPVKGNSPGLPDTNFPFELLPAGTWNFRHALEYGYNRLRSPHGYWDQRFDQGRIDSMKLLDPKLTHIGRKAWSGYAVYEFSYSKRVVLECPIEGNATYVLSGDWKKMISLTKAEVRRGHTGRLTRIFHTVNWLSRVRQALRY